MRRRQQRARQRQRALRRAARGRGREGEGERGGRPDFRWTAVSHALVPACLCSRMTCGTGGVAGGLCQPLKRRSGCGRASQRDRGTESERQRAREREREGRKGTLLEGVSSGSLFLSLPLRSCALPVVFRGGPAALRSAARVHPRLALPRTSSTAALSTWTMALRRLGGSPAANALSSLDAMAAAHSAGGWREVQGRRGGARGAQRERGRGGEGKSCLGEEAFVLKAPDRPR